MQHNQLKKSLRVLILEDVPTDAELVEQELRSAGIEFVSTRVDNQDSFLEALDSFSPEIILSDYSLPAFDGEAALSIARKRVPSPPFIFVTGALGEERAVDLLKNGATDYVLKDRLIRLPLCVKRAMDEVEEKRRRQEAEKELRRAHAELEREVEERTMDLQQRTLELQQLTETLEQRVQKRTAEMEKANEALMDLSSRLLSAQEDERKRIAGEIHDTLGACLSAAKFKLEGVLQQFGETSPTVVEPLNTIIPVIQEGIEECRRIQMDLRPPLIDDVGLLATLSWFCRRFQAIYSGIRIDQEKTLEENEVPDSLKIVIYRVTQEAMNNIAKHSKADFITLSIKGEGNKIELTIKDNGMGFDVKETLSRGRSQRGLGLESMRERVESSGGSFSLESSKGKGTIIRASWSI